MRPSTNATATLRNRNYDTGLAHRVAAYPDAGSPFVWHGIVDTERALYQLDASIFTSSQLDSDDGLTVFKPEVGAGATYEASRILHEFYAQLATEPYLTFNAGLALGGTLVSVDTTGTEGTAAGKRNVVPDKMTVTGDIRALTPDA